MLKLFQQLIDHTNAATIQRDMAALEAKVNSYLASNTRLKVNKTELQPYDKGGTTYFSILLDYTVDSNNA